VSFEDEITRAIAAHGTWKKWLRSAIDNGKADADPVEVARDDGCQFGQWLYGPTIPDVVRASTDYKSVRRLHADFHKCAANVLELAGHGHKAQADALMAGEYARVSADLTSAMAKWMAASH
jgi:hypothetical protein